MASLRGSTSPKCLLWASCYRGKQTPFRLSGCSWVFILCSQTEPHLVDGLTCSIPFPPCSSVSFLSSCPGGQPGCHPQSLLASTPRSRDPCSTCAAEGALGTAFCSTALPSGSAASSAPGEQVVQLLTLTRSQAHRGFRGQCGW